MMEYEVHRIENLREKALGRQICYDEFYYYFHKRMLSNGGVSYLLRYADALYDSFRFAAVEIDGEELIVGKPSEKSLSEEEKREWEQIKQIAFAHMGTPFGQDSHMAIDYELLLSKGIYGIIDTITSYRTALDLTNVNEIAKDEFYLSCQKCLEGVICFSERYADEAKRQAEDCNDSNRKMELYEIERICRKVPAHPAQTFYEALQSIHFVTFCLSNKPLRYTHLQYQFGRPDRYLYPFYKTDKNNGVITPKKAQTLLDCFGIMINNRVPNGLSCGYMVGGRAENGHVVSNELTAMLLHVIDQNRLVYPAVGFCYCSDTPEEDLSLAVSIVSKGHSHPAIFNDDVISKGLQYYGLTPKESCSYIHSTCVEITPIGSSNVWVASPYTNLVQKLLDILNSEYNSIDDVLNAFLQHLSIGIKAEFIEQNRQRNERYFHSVDPLLSCFVNDCLKNGTDIERGGARYNWIMPSFVGIANVADALMTIETLLIKQKRYTFCELKNMLEQNFMGYEKDRQSILNHIEKYGNDNDSADRYVKIITKWISEECSNYITAFSNGKLIPSLFCWVMHERLGSQTGASPDGRLSGFPLGDGSGPAQGREHNGPTASILSSTKWDHSKFIGGIAINMKFTKSMLTDDSQAKLKTLIKTYINRGGFELQINVVDNETLQKAKENPELYADLVVRIGGYSDYFVKLSPAMQAEVMERTGHHL